MCTGGGGGGVCSDIHMNGIFISRGPIGCFCGPSMIPPSKFQTPVKAEIWSYNLVFSMAEGMVLSPKWQVFSQWCSHACSSLNQKSPFCLCEEAAVLWERVQMASVENRQQRCASHQSLVEIFVLEIFLNMGGTLKEVFLYWKFSICVRICARLFRNSLSCVY